MEKEITIKFEGEEVKQIPLLWNAVYSIRAGIPTAKLRLHNLILIKLEIILGLPEETEPLPQLLQSMESGIAVLAAYTLNVSVPNDAEIDLKLTNVEFNYLKNVLTQTQWTPAVSRLAEKLSDKFGIGD